MCMLNYYPQSRAHHQYYQQYRCPDPVVAWTHIRKMAG